MKSDIKLYYVIPILFFVILVVIILLLPGKKTTSTTIYTTPVVLPTKTTTGGKSNSSLSSNPTTPLVPVYTGGTNEQLPSEVIDLAAQKKALRKKTPLSQPLFLITFDFATDTFTVTLNEPKNTSRTSFEEWLKTNYSAIPLDRFTFK